MSSEFRVPSSEFRVPSSEFRVPSSEFEGRRKVGKNSAEKVILLVEDNPDDVALTLRALRRNGVLNKVVVVGDGAEALEYLLCTGAYADREPGLPEVVLLDLKLPKVDGLEVLKRVRAHERTKLLPVVVLTSSDEEKDLVNSYKFGANSYVRKPVDFDDFRQAVQQLKLYWLLLNVPPPQSRG